MLVLSRKRDERIVIGDSIVITVVEVRGDKVRLGIEAPPDVLVLRDELRPHAPSTDAETDESEQKPRHKGEDDDSFFFSEEDTSR